MLPEPEYLDKDNVVTLTLRNRIASHQATISELTMNKVERLFFKLSPTEIQIVNYLFENHQVTITELLNYIHKTETAVRSALNSLIEVGIIVKQSENSKLRDKNAIYSFKKS